MSGTGHVDTVYVCTSYATCSESYDRKKVSVTGLKKQKKTKEKKAVRTWGALRFNKSGVHPGSDVNNLGSTFPVRTRDRTQTG